MSVINRSSAQITNRDASPQILNDPGVCGGAVKRCVAKVTATNADSATSVYRMFQIPSNAVIASLKMVADALGTGAKVNIGVYQTSENGGAVVASQGSLFASAVDVAAATALTDYRYSALTASGAEKQLWDLMGLSADPCILYDICVVVNVAIATTGSLALECTYVQ